MRCPYCKGSNVEMTSAVVGRGSGWACYDCSPYGHPFSSNRLDEAAKSEAQKASDAAKALSASNAKAYRDKEQG
jgi:hypothetical protein